MERGLLVLCLAAAGVLAACANGQNEPEPTAWTVGDSSYVFTAPDEMFELETDLEEISGLAFMDDGMLAAIQDEDGVLFILDPASGSIVERRTFGESGDYEAVDIADGRLYVLRSDGRVQRFDTWSGSEPVGDTLHLDLPSRCDAEGMRFDLREERLLVSCKDEPGPGLEVEKAIYAFDPEGRALSDAPAYVIDSRRFSASVDEHPINEAVRSVLSERVDLSGFRPSELAIHPVTDELFVLSSVREAIVALDRSGEVTSIWPLSEDLMNQPEGMAFLPNGDLFVASEAGDRKNAVLLRFNYKSNAPSSADS